MLGEIYLQQNNKPKAVENYLKAVQLDDYNVMSHYYLYQLYLEKGDSVNAKQNIEKLKQYSPDIFN
jgi:tetratricopeptide (TPR) repeat protein